MKKVIFCLILAILVASLSFGTASSDIVWFNLFGGAEYDELYSVQQTADQGYVVTGRTSSIGAGGIDVYLIRVNAGLGQAWRKAFGGTGQDAGYSVQETNDSGYIIAGFTESFGAGLQDAWLIKTDSSGNEEWNRTFGDANPQYFKSAQETSDGGYIAVGATKGFDWYEAYLVKTNSSGDTEWSKTFGGNTNDFATSAQETSDGGFILVGKTGSYGAGGVDVWLIKTNSSGSVEWNKTFGGTGQDTGYAIQETSDGGFIITGATRNFGSGWNDMWLIKTNSSGNEEWNKTFGGTEEDYGYSVDETSDGGFVVTGETYSYGAGAPTYSNVYIVRVNSSGDFLWNETTGGAGGEDVGNSIIQTSAGDYIVAGYKASSPSDGLLIKFRDPTTNAIENHKEALDILNSLSLEGKAQKALNEAIDALTKSLGNEITGGDESIIWVDGQHVECAGGSKVFAYGREIERHLSSIDDESVLGEVGSAINLVVYGDRLLAKTAISEDANNTNAIRSYQKGEDEMDSNKRILNYKQAWSAVNKPCK